jgi:hypothetical protein
MQEKRKPRGHHTVPRFYLEGFSDPRSGKLWVYTKGCAPRSSLPLNECRRRDYYAFELGETKLYDFEHVLSVFETYAGELFKKLQDNGYAFSENDKSFLSNFVALTFSRVPAFRDHARDAYQSILDRARQPEKLITLAQEATHDLKKPISVEIIRSQLDATTFQLSKHDLRSLQWIVDNVNRLAPILFSMHWKVLESEQESFITSDNPVVTRIENSSGISLGEGFARPDVYVYFPLNCKACLIMSKKPFRPVRSAAVVREINKSLMCVAKHCIYVRERNDNINKLFQKIGCTYVYGKHVFVAPKNEVEE